MTERDECTLQSSEPKIPKQEIGGGNSIEPKRGFYKNEPIDKLYIKGMHICPRNYYKIVQCIIGHCI
jgi:hypothetical protein